MPVRPSFKLAPGEHHGAIGVERVGDGDVHLDLYDVAFQHPDEGPSLLALSSEEAVELAAMLRAVVGNATDEERAMLTAVGEPEPTPLGQSIIEASERHHPISGGGE